DVSTLNDGTITYTATATDAAANTTTDSMTAFKDTVIAVAVTAVTDAVNQGNESTTSASGTTDNDTNTVSVKVSDGSTNLGPFAATVASGAWSVSGIDVSTLNDGTITYTATASDAAGNSTSDAKTAVKDTAIAVSITTVTDAVNQGNQTSAAASGTTDE